MPLERCDRDTELHQSLNKLFGTQKWEKNGKSGERKAIYILCDSRYSDMLSGKKSAVLYLEGKAFKRFSSDFLQGTNDIKALAWQKCLFNSN